MRNSLKNRGEITPITNNIDMQVLEGLTSDTFRALQSVVAEATAMKRERRELENE